MSRSLWFCLFFVTLISSAAVWAGDPAVGNIVGEKVVYAISPLGKAEYIDRGIVDFQGKKARLVTFQTMVFGFDDLEKIYVDTETSLPLKVERNISWLFSKEYIEEDYFSDTHTLRIRKYENNQVISEQSFSAKGPIQNAVWLPFSLRVEGDFSIGSTFDVRFPEEFKVALTSIDDLTLPAGSFKAYHFVSTPHKFEIWIGTDQYRIPLMIKGSGGVGYSMQVQSYSVNGKAVYPKQPEVSSPATVE